MPSGILEYIKANPDLLDQYNKEVIDYVKEHGISFEDYELDSIYDDQKPPAKQLVKITALLKQQDTPQNILLWMEDVTHAVLVEKLGL